MSKKILISLVALAIAACLPAFAQEEIMIGTELGPEHMFGGFINPGTHQVFRDRLYFYPTFKTGGFNYHRGSMIANCWYDGGTGLEAYAGIMADSAVDLKFLSYAAAGPDTGFSADGEGLPPLPRDLELAAYPNPFNSTIQVRMNLPAAGLLSVVVRDISGRRVAGTNQISAPAGGYAWTWDAKNAPAGVYLISAMLHAAGGSVKKDIKVVKIN